MIAITVLLGILAATGVFSQLDPYGVSEPQVETAYFYTEDHEATELDSFGMSGNAYGDGWTTIEIESAANALNAEQLTVEVGGTSYSWANYNTPYNVGDNVGVGDSINVWAERGDTVLITWESPDGEESFILGSYTIPEVGPAISGGVPDPDEDCEWVEDQLGPPGSSGDLTIDGIVVECDLDAWDVQKLVIKNKGAVIGEVEADGDIDITDGATYNGNVEMLSGGNDVDIDDGSEITGNVNAQGGVALDASSKVNGDVIATGDVDVDGNSQIGGSIDTDGNVKLNEGGSGGVTVGGSVDADGDIDIYTGSTVDGDVESTNSGSITLTDSTVLGYVATNEDVDLDGSTVGDDVYEDNGFSCDSSTIDGTACGSYTTKSYPPP